MKRFVQYFKNLQIFHKFITCQLTSAKKEPPQICKRKSVAAVVNGFDLATALRTQNPVKYLRWSFVKNS